MRMKAGEAAERAGVTVRALRYYEKMGLIAPRRLHNDYREYDPLDVALVREIRGLTELGFAVGDTRPFLDCLLAGNARADVCPESLAAYRRAIDDLSERIAELALRRDTLEQCLGAAIGMLPGMQYSAAPARTLQVDLDPARIGTAEEADVWHWPLAGRRLPPLSLVSTAGETVRLAQLRGGRTVLYVYPLTGRPGIDLPKGWETIPGAKGCTAEACGFRDHYAELTEAGAAHVFGISSQSTDYQRELVGRLRLPFHMLSDEALSLAESMGLPTFEADGMRLFRRLTLIVRDGAVEHAFYPVEAPAGHAGEVLDWLRRNPVT